MYFAYEEYCSNYSNSPVERNFSPAEITGTLDSQSAESCSIGSPLLPGLTKVSQPIWEKKIQQNTEKILQSNISIF